MVDTAAREHDSPARNTLRKDRPGPALSFTFLEALMSDELREQLEVYRQRLRRYWPDL